MRTLVVAFTLCAVVAAQPASDLDRLFHTYQWFELRPVVNSRSPALIRAGVATAFNDVETAERVAREIIKAGPTSPDADEAYYMLAQIYRRSGQFTRWTTLQREWVAAFPESARARTAGEDGQESSGWPDQINGQPRQVVLKHDPGDITIPVSINGIVDDYVFDTGADVSVVTALRAKKLGLTVDETPRKIGGSSGQSAAFHTAIAKQIEIGGVQFRNVSFAVIDGLPSAIIDAGVIGLPVLLGLGSIRWSPDGEVEIGVPAAKGPSDPNLAFDRDELLLKVRVLGRDVMTTFDTGASTTDLNENFATMFPDAVKDASKGTTDITGVGGTKTFDSLKIPELSVGIGPSTVWLRPATITLQKMSNMGGECCIGNAGDDLLKGGFTIDFATMTLRVDAP